MEHIHGFFQMVLFQVMFAYHCYATLCMTNEMKSQLTVKLNIHCEKSQGIM